MSLDSEGDGEVERPASLTAKAQLMDRADKAITAVTQIATGDSSKLNKNDISLGVGDVSGCGPSGVACSNIPKSSIERKRSPATYAAGQDTGESIAKLNPPGVPHAVGLKRMTQTLIGRTSELVWLDSILSEGVPLLPIMAIGQMKVELRIFNDEAEKKTNHNLRRLKYSLPTLALGSSTVATSVVSKSQGSYNLNIRANTSSVMRRVVLKRKQTNVRLVEWEVIEGASSSNHQLIEFVMRCGLEGHEQVRKINTIRYRDHFVNWDRFCAQIEKDAGALNV
ncbi:hypothetical protein EVAR_78068_1 [Eumeta japonica]|uniref:Uncharacterized protein n=1 Tax=Eumeta variegata TaxID=151549 RepID=A0A4C1T0A5_EUMVA|nr:hypothetical protein EVAR_78068_1 [Eumeta japonica]